MRRTIMLGLMAAMWAGGAGVNLAGQLNAPASSSDTNSAMYTLNDIYNRLLTGATTNPVAFTEPAAGPTSGTMHTLNEIYSNAIPTHVPRTGQTPTLPNPTPNPATSDGKLQKGMLWPNPRFTVVGAAGTSATNQIMDNLTGLIWARDANIASNTGWSLSPMLWSNAFDVVTNSTGPINGSTGVNGPNGYGGTNDWRLPNVRELYSLLSVQYDTPSLSDWTGTNKWTSGNPFVGVDLVTAYWTSSTSVYGGADCAFHINMFDGQVNYHAKATTAYWVWPVRGGR